MTQGEWTSSTKFVLGVARHDKSAAADREAAAGLSSTATRPRRGRERAVGFLVGSKSVQGLGLDPSLPVLDTPRETCSS